MKNLTSLAVTALVTTFAIGCGDNAEPDDMPDDLRDVMNDVVEVVPQIPSPRTCAEMAQGKPKLADGEYVLNVDNDPSKPWTAYCVDMDTKTPKEYLTLSTSAPTNMNVSMYRAGGRSTGTDVTTKFDKVRVDPKTLQIDISDQTFAISDGSATGPNGETITSMPFGVAMTCGGGYATAMVDIRDTPFVLQNKFALGGDTGVRGNADPWAGNQVIEMWTDGDCGWIAAENAPAPMNSAGTFLIGLTYQK